MGCRRIQMAIGTLALMVAAGCNIAIPEEIITPTVEVIASATPTTEASTTPTPTLSPSPTQAASEEPVILATPQPIEPVGVPTLPPQPSETPGPYVHVIQPGEILSVIVQRYGYGYDPNLFAEIARLNDNMPSPDLLPAAGSEILIPRQTATPIPEGIELTRVADAQMGMERFGNVLLPSGAQTDCHVVQEGETIIGIAEQYSTTLEVISQFNQTLNWSGCRFDVYSGGENCRPNIRPGDCIVVPMPTPVPTSTATPSGDETATPTPTFPPARAIFPADGAIASAGVFSLQWVSVGTLASEDVYLVEVVDLTAGGTSWVQVTSDTALRLPESLIPTDGTTHLMQWRVSVARRDNQGAYRYIGGIGDWRSFQWQSR